MALETEIIRDVYVSCGNPPQRILPLTIVSPQIHQALRYYSAGLELSPQNLTLKTWGPFTPSGIEMAVSSSLAFGDPAIVEIATDSTETDWDPIRIVNLDVLEVSEHSGERAVAFFGDPPRMQFSWDPTLDPMRIRVRYDEILADPQAVDAVIAALPDYYISMVSARVALNVIPDILERAPEREASLAVRAARLTTVLAEWEKKWEWKTNDRHQQGSTHRPAFNRGRSGWGRYSGRY